MDPHPPEAAAVGSDPLVGPVRTDPLPEQGASTYGRAAAALAAGRLEACAELVEYAAREAEEAFELYDDWIERLPGLIVAMGADLGRVDGVAARTSAACGLAGPGDARREWTRFIELSGAIRTASDPAPTLDRARAQWLGLHDRMLAHVCALLELAARELGESAIGPLWDGLLAEFYAGVERYDPAERPWGESVEPLLLDIVAAARGHLSGPARDGSLEIEEKDDRWLLTIPMCGSGGRSFAREGELGKTREGHDWSWGAAGVCFYCVHCCQLQQRNPIDRIGVPVRVVEPPRWPEAGERPVCRWTIYKRLDRVPADAYTSVGARPPVEKD